MHITYYGQHRYLVTRDMQHSLYMAESVWWMIIKSINIPTSTIWIYGCMWLVPINCLIIIIISLHIYIIISLYHFIF